VNVRIYPVDASGCGTYRCLLPAQTLAAQGFHVETADIPDTGTARAYPIQRHPRNPRMVRARPLPGIDVIVFQRPVEEEIARVAIPQLQAAGHAIVVEIDDDLHRLDPRQPTFQLLSRHAGPAVNLRHLMDCCRQANLVTASTPAVAARYAPHGRYHVIPNFIPQHLLDSRSLADGATVGWAGWTVTHPGDLRACAGGVAQALDAADGTFLQIGPSDGVREQLAIPPQRFSATGALPDIRDYHRALARLTVGICPLADTRFNAAKSWLKPLEMAACGAAVVASPVTEYQHAAQLGLCELAGWRGREWHRMIRRLLTDPGYRAERIAGARAAASRLTVERNAHLWWEAWQQAQAHRRNTPRHALAAT
jgi:hypothetical protein